MISNPERKQRALNRINAAIRELQSVLEEFDYDPDSATQEEKIIAGMIASLSILKRQHENP